jgi:hypothetical protein
VKREHLLRIAAGVLMALLAAEPLLLESGRNQRSAVALAAILPVVLGGVALAFPRSPFGLLFAAAFVAEYGLALSLADGEVDQLAPLLGLALLAIFELLEQVPLRSRAGRLKVEPALRQAQIMRWLVVGAAGLATGALALAATSASTAGDNAAWRTLGMGAGVLAIAVPVIAARRLVGSRRSRLFDEVGS